MSSISIAQQNELAERLTRAVGLLQGGDLGGAETILESVIGIDPRHPVALHLLGTISLQRGDLTQATEYLEDALAINPRSAAARCDLGLVLAQSGDFIAARDQLQKAVELRPDFAEAWFNLARVLGQLGDAAGAYRALRQALARKPDLADARLLLARHLLESGRPREAEAELRDLLRRQPQSGPAFRTLARALDMLGRRQDALDAHRRAAELIPGDAAVLAELGDTLAAFGDRPAAIDAYRRALALAPDRADWRRVIAMLEGDDSDISADEARFGDPLTSDDERMHLGFSLGAAYERQGDFERAFEALRTGNQLRRRSIRYLPAASERAFADIEQAFSAELFARHTGAGIKDSTPIFVLGMPRSGTTLAEQILASHPDVVGAGELPLLRELVAGAAGKPEVVYRELLERLDDAALTKLGSEYLRQLRGYSSAARHITDKMPGNFLLIGFIRLCLPEAKVIHCVRDPLDTCLSIYRNYFTTSLGYAWDLGEIGHYYRLYQHLMAHWQTVLPGFVYDLGYEALIADQEGETRRLLAHCGLDFRPETLAFHETDRSIHTASAVQVRSPLGAASIGIAGRYGAALDPLRRALAGER